MLRVAVSISLVLHIVLLSILQVPEMAFRGGAAGQRGMRVQLTSVINIEEVHSVLPLPRSIKEGGGVAKHARRAGTITRPGVFPASPAQSSVENRQDGSLYGGHASERAPKPSQNRTEEGADLADLSRYRLAIAQVLRKIQSGSPGIPSNKGMAVAVTVSVVNVLNVPRVSLARSSGDFAVDRSLLSIIESAIAACPVPESLANVPFELHVVLDGLPGEN